VSGRTADIPGDQQLIVLNPVREFAFSYQSSDTAAIKMLWFGWPTEPIVQYAAVTEPVSLSGKSDGVSADRRRSLPTSNFEQFLSSSIAGDISSGIG
jgi:hypothetical protein